MSEVRGKKVAIYLIGREGGRRSEERVRGESVAAPCPSASSSPMSSCSKCSPSAALCKPDAARKLSPVKSSQFSPSDGTLCCEGIRVWMRVSTQRAPVGPHAHEYRIDFAQESSTPHITVTLLDSGPWDSHHDSFGDDSFGEVSGWLG